MARKKPQKKKNSTGREGGDYTSHTPWNLEKALDIKELSRKNGELKEGYAYPEHLRQTQSSCSTTKKKKPVDNFAEEGGNQEKD